MEFYKSCRTLSIYSFNEILRSNDLRFLIKDFDEYNDEEIKLVGVDAMQASEIFKEIIYEYSSLTFNRSILKNYMSQINIEKEEFRYNITEKILNFYAESEDLSILETLNNLDWKMDINGDINSQIKIIIASMRKFRTKINILKLKHDEKFKKKVIVDNEDSYVDVLESEAISLEIALKISHSIDTKNTSVSKWISMWSVANKMNKPKNN
jgi:hypothetical protein